MVRERPVVTARVGGWLLLATSLLSNTSASAAESTVSDDRRPYRITVQVAVDPDARIDEQGRARMLKTWSSLVSRFVGAPWEVTIDPGDRGAADVDLESVQADRLDPLIRGFDKLWLFQVGRDGAELTLAGRELDAATGRLGPMFRERATVQVDLPRALFTLALEVFRPLASVGEASGGGVSIVVRGGSLQASSSEGALVGVGTFFRPIRILTLPDGGHRVLDIPYTYLRVESIEDASAHCSIASGLRDPLTGRYVQKNVLVALGSKPGPYPTRLVFQTLPDRLPAAGYRLTARPLPDGITSEVGTTDRQGRITLGRSFSDRLVALRLLAGSAEPLREFPLMPGELAEERVVSPFDPHLLTVALETQLDALRDEVLDLVAVRARLEARLKARFDGEDWPGAEAILQDYARLPPRDRFAARLNQLREDATQQQARTKSAVLTKTAQAQIAELEGMIARYLDDEIFRGFADALVKVRSDAAKEKSKTKAAKKAGPQPVVPKK